MNGWVSGRAPAYGWMGAPALAYGWASERMWTLEECGGQASILAKTRVSKA